MLYQNQNDETLVMLTLAGEEKAYEALVVRYERAVILSAASVTRNEFMAEDAAQDAFVTAWMKLNTLQKLRDCLRNMAPEVRIEESLRRRAAKPLERMLELSL